MGLLHESYREEGPQASLDMRSFGENPFKSYVYPDIVVSLSIGEYRFEREISESRKIRNQRINGKKYDHIIDLNIFPHEVPEYLLEGVSREAFIAKWEARLGTNGWGVSFIPQEDGSYAANEDFFKYIVSDIVSRVKKV